MCLTAHVPHGCAARDARRAGAQAVCEARRARRVLILAARVAPRAASRLCAVRSLRLDSAPGQSGRVSRVPAPRLCAWTERPGVTCPCASTLRLDRAAGCHVSLRLHSAPGQSGRVSRVPAPPLCAWTERPGVTCPCASTLRLDRAAGCHVSLRLDSAPGQSGRVSRVPAHRLCAWTERPGVTCPCASTLRLDRAAGCHVSLRLDSTPAARRVTPYARRAAWHERLTRPLHSHRCSLPPRTRPSPAPHAPVPHPHGPPGPTLTRPLRRRAPAGHRERAAARAVDGLAGNLQPRPHHLQRERERE
jgi:hypothetical protein